MNGAALAVSPRHREKDEPEAAEHRVVEELCCAVPRGDEARWSCAAKQQRRGRCDARWREEDDS